MIVSITNYHELSRNYHLTISSRSDDQSLHLLFDMSFDTGLQFMVELSKAVAHVFAHAVVAAFQFSRHRYIGHVGTIEALRLQIAQNTIDRLLAILLELLVGTGFGNLVTEGSNLNNS